MCVYNEIVIYTYLINPIITIFKMCVCVCVSVRISTLTYITYVYIMHLSGYSI